MAEKIDLDQVLNKDNEPSPLDKKLSAFDGEEKTSANTQTTEDAGKTKSISKEEMAKMIAQRLAQDDEYEVPVKVEKSPAKKTPKTQKTEKKPTEEKEKSNSGTMGIVIGFFVGLVVVALVAFYVGGLVMTSGKFLPGTTINGQDVSMKTASQVAEMFEDEDAPKDILFYEADGSTKSISLSSIGYEIHRAEKIQEILDSKNTVFWFTSLVKPKSYKVDLNAATFDENKLRREIGYISWSEVEPTDAYIKSTDDGLVIVPEVEGQKVDGEKLFEYAKEQIKEGNLNIQVSGADVSVPAEITSADLEDDLKLMQAISGLEITIDFDYTTEKLTGNDIANWISFNDDGSYNVDRTKVLGYVGELARKYDTYNTVRKFNATLQGEINVPISSDAYYGWKIHQEDTADLLVELIEKGENTTVDPVYDYMENADGTKGYIFTGREEARSADDDIGDTYVEVDLTAQTLWHYVDGEMVYTCKIVSGQTNPEVRKTLPGVYKVWQKRTNYTMTSSNSAGDSWSVKCNYWTRVSIVGIGLHDSTWRGSNFGGEIYKTNGSHGCINMPLAGAKYIYENVDMSTPVVMYY